MVVGFAQPDGGSRTAVAWHGSRCSALGPDPLPDQRGAQAMAIGESGLVAGTARNDAGEHVALWWPDGTSAVLPPDGRAVSVNRRDEVLIQNNHFGPSHLYRPDGALRDLHPLPRGSMASVHDVNGAGWGVGYSDGRSRFPGGAALWMPGREVEDLNHLLAVPLPTQLTEATAVDESGRILVNSTWDGLYLLTPEPGCAPLLRSP